MRVTHLSLTDFRNYRSAEVSFLPGHNLIIGRNGQGKTNLVEAIAYFSTLGSHRVTQDSALIRANQVSAVMRMKVAARERQVLLEMQLNKDRPNRAQVNRNAVRPRELPRWFTCVVFAPEDLSLVRGEPGIRRRFVDEALISRQPSFAATLSDYDRVVKQRSALLKSARGVSNKTAIESTLEIWDGQLIELGAAIMLARRELVESLITPLRNSYFSIVETDHRPTLKLDESVVKACSVSRETSQSGVSPQEGVSRETLQDQFASALVSVRKKELERGVTLVGPHRDDLLLGLNDLPVKGYASHGESWSFALSLRLALATLLRGESQTGDPVLILDDVFAELDGRRRNALMTEVSKFEQTIVTAAVQADVPSAEWNRVYIEAGEVREG